jgi:hypothetical protein
MKALRLAALTGQFPPSDPSPRFGRRFVGLEQNTLPREVPIVADHLAVVAN